MRISESENITNGLLGNGGVSFPLEIKVECNDENRAAKIIDDTINDKTLLKRGHIRISVLRMKRGFDLLNRFNHEEWDYAAVFFVAESAEPSDDGTLIVYGNLIRISDKNGIFFETENMYRFIYTNLLTGNFKLTCHLDIPTLEITNVYDIVKEEGLTQVNPQCL